MPEDATQTQLDQALSMTNNALDGMIAAGKLAGMSDAALVALQKLTIVNVAALRENKPCINFSVLIVEYGDFCRELEQHPIQRAKVLCN